MKRKYKPVNTSWDKIYKHKKLSYVSNLSTWEDVVLFLQKRSTHTILDVGCGGGQHLLSLAKKGFNVSGIDNSSEAITIAKHLFKKNKLEANLLVADMHRKIPFKDKSFDVIYSLRTLNHGDIEEIENTFSEIGRVLEKNGILFFTVQKILGLRGSIGKHSLNDLTVDFVKPRTYVKLESDEKGIMHFLFNKNILIKLLRGYRILKFWVDYGKQDWEKYYCVLAEKIS